MARDKGLPRRLLLAQLAATLALALMLLPLGSKHALSGFAGGMIALVANGFFVTRVFAPYRAQQLERMVGNFARELARDPDMQLWVDGWLQESAVALVEERRGAFASLISETVRSWDARETSRRVEAAIGTDLQYIRINGTLVGGLVGILIHAVKML